MAGLGVELDDRGLGASGQRRAFCNLGADHIILVLAERDRRQHGDDRNDDHHLDQREASVYAHRSTPRQLLPGLGIGGYTQGVTISSSWLLCKAGTAAVAGVAGLIPSPTTVESTS